MTDFKKGDRVTIRAEKSHRLGFLNGLQGTVQTSALCGVGGLTVMLDGERYAYYIPTELLVPIAAASEQVMPVDSAARKDVPVTTGVFDYFPAALAEVAKVSKAGNDKHNPGEPLHWARGKSMDQADAIGRHLIDRGGIDPDTGMRHSAELAWRALAMLQLELEEAGAPIARGASA